VPTQLNLSLNVLHDEKRSNAFAGAIPLGFPSICSAVSGGFGCCTSVAVTHKSQRDEMEVETH
jgi:hypothetical protein